MAAPLPGLAGNTQPPTEDQYPQAAAVDRLVAAGRVHEAARLARDTLAQPSLPSGHRVRLRLALAGVRLISAQPQPASRDAQALTEPDPPAPQDPAAQLSRLYGWLAAEHAAPARAVAESILAGAERPGSDAVLAGGLTALAWTAWCQGRLDAGLGLIGAASGRAGRAWPRGQHPRLVLAGMLTALGDFDGAGTAIREAAEEIALAGDTPWDALPPLLGARLHLAAGRLADAVTGAERALAIADEHGPHLVVPPAHAMLAVVAVRRGDLDRAAEHLERCRPAPGWPTVPPASAGHIWAQAQVAEARDGWSGAMTLLTGTIRALPGQPGLLLQEPAAAAWLVRGALATGDVDAARTVAECAGQLAADNPGHPCLRVVAVHARGVLDGDAAALERATAAYRHPWSAASAAEDAGLAHGGAARPARAAFELALRRYEQAGASRDAARLRSRLRFRPRRLGGRRGHRTAAAAGSDPHRGPCPGWTPEDPR